MAVRASLATGEPKVEPLRWSVLQALDGHRIEPRRTAASGPLAWVRLFFVGGPTSLCDGGEAGGGWIRQRVAVVRKRRRGPVFDGTVPSATAGGFPLVLARFVEGLSTHQSAGCRWRLEDRRSRRHAGRPIDEPATSTARRIAAATWMMSSTTVLPGRTRRCPRGGRDAHAAHLEQVPLRQRVQRGIEPRQAVAPRGGVDCRFGVPAGVIFSSGTRVSTSGRVVAHTAVRQVLWKPARRSPATSRS